MNYRQISLNDAVAFSAGGICSIGRYCQRRIEKWIFNRAARNGIRLISVTGDISEDDPVAANEVIEALENEILPEIASERQVEWRLAGLAEQEDQFRTDAARAHPVFDGHLSGAYMDFASWTRPIIVMAIIPFGLIGTIWGHYIWDIPMSMFTVIGLLGMTGIIINDSIVLIPLLMNTPRIAGLFRR